MQLEKNSQKKLKNLFSQILQLKNWLRFLGGGLIIFVPLHCINSNSWPRTKPLFLIWIFFISVWFLFLLFSYKQELGNRIILCIISIAKKAIPFVLVIFSIYLILRPFESKNILGILILLVVYLDRRRIASLRQRFL